MTKLTSTVGCLIFAGALLLPAPAWADASPGDAAAAEVLFTDAKKLVAEGRFNDACPKFEESQRLDPTPGTLLNLGDCFQHLSPPRTASAWGAYQQASIQARNRGDTARQEAASQRAQAIEPVLSRVTISPAPAARIPGLDVKWDGRSVGAGLWGTAIPVDSGEHTIEANAPGKRSWTGKVLVRLNGGTSNVEVPVLAHAPNEIGSGGAGTPRGWSTQRTIGLVIGGVGLAGIVVGSIFGAKAMRKNAESLPHCLPTDFLHCDPDGIVLGHEAIKAGNVSTVGFLVGGAGLVGGTIVFLTAPSTGPKGIGGGSRLRAEPLVGSSAGGLLFSGEW
jgi:hypothetical protein